MARRCDDGVIADRLQFGDRFPVDPTVGNDGCHIIARVGAAVGGDGTEIAEIFLDQRNEIDLRATPRNQPIVGGQQLGPRHDVRVTRAENFLGHFQHLRLIGLGNAEQLHDDPQRVPKRDFTHEITGRPKARHPVDMGPRNRPDPGFHDPQVCGQEPFVRQLAQLHMFRVIQIDKRPEQMAVPRHGLGGFFGCNRGQVGAFAVDEPAVGLRNGGDVGMAGDRPEGAKPGWCRPMHRIVPPQRSEQRMHLSLVRDNLRVDQRIVGRCPGKAGENSGGIRHSKSSSSGGRLGDPTGLQQPRA